MCDEGDLPNVDRIRRNGSWGEVRSDAGRFSGSPWPSFFTARDVSFHAVYHWMQWDPDTRRLRAPGPSWCPAPAFWERLSEDGLPVTTLDVPFARVNPGLPGWTAVLGWSTNEALWRESSPPGLLREIERRFGRSAQSREVPGPRPEAAFRRELNRRLRDVTTRVSIIEYLAQTFPWRLMLACFSETHYAGHWHWSGRATGEAQGGLRRVLRAFDSCLPRLEALLGPNDQLAIFSTHGMGPKTGLEGFARPIEQYLASNERDPGRLTNPLPVLRRAVPVDVRRLLARNLPPALYNSLVSRYVSAGKPSRTSTIVNAGDDVLYVTVNLPDGDESARAQRVAELESKAGAVRDPGGHCFLAVDKPAELYSGPRSRFLPDLVVRDRADSAGAETITIGDMTVGKRSISWQDGGHNADGFYLQSGPGTSPGPGNDVEVQDLASLLCGAASIGARPTL